MRVTTTSGQEDPRPWRIRDALKEKAALTPAEIEELFARRDHLDLVELGMTLEEEFGIEIVDEDLLIPPNEKQGEPQS